MIDLNLSPAHTKQYLATLTTSHQIRCTLIIRDSNEDVLKQLVPRMISGSVMCDTTQDVPMSASMVFLDPKHDLEFDSNSPGAGALFADNFIQVLYGVFVEAMNDWVDVPVFYGPVTAFSRAGAEVTIEAQGKETLALDPHLVIHGYTIPHGTLVQHAVRNVMNRIGERSYRINMLSGRLRTHRAVTPGEEPWRVLVGGGQDANGKSKPGIMRKGGGHNYLFYDARGDLTAKPKHTKPKHTFTEADLASQPGFTYDVLAVRNHVEVTGGTPKHSHKHHHGTASLPASHPLSAHALRRNGAPRYMTVFFQSDTLKSNAACRVKARQILNGLTHEGIQAQFDSLVIPHLQGNDAIALSFDGIHFNFLLEQYTIPLTADAPMNVGYNGVAHVKTRHKPKHKHHHHHHHRKGH